MHHKKAKRWKEVHSFPKAIGCRHKDQRKMYIVLDNMRNLDVGTIVHAAALIVCLWEGFLQRFPEPKTTIFNGQQLLGTVPGGADYD